MELMKSHPMSRFLAIFWLFSFTVFSREPLPASRYSYLTGVKFNRDSKAHWDQRFNRPNFVFGKAPASFLAENYFYIPTDAQVLDMGMGEGRNAVFLAQKSYKVTGIDISSVAIKKAFLLAKEYGVKIKGVVASMKSYQIPNGSYDAIVCFYYVDRSLNEKIRAWLKPGGILIYEAYTKKQKKNPTFKNEPDEIFLQEQELLKMFPGMKVLKFEEPQHEKDFRSGIILQKPL